jgi:fatty-acyl-CoA synthase
MQGLMMDRQLTITSIMEHADNNHPNAEIVSVTCDSPRHRYTYADAFRRTRRLANALIGYGIRPGDRVATFAWNDYRHFELYYGIAGIGAVTHTVNPRLFPDQITYIVNHAEDRLVFVDPLVVPALEKIKDDLPCVEAYVILTDDDNMPDTGLKNAQSYEFFIGSQPDRIDWPELDEKTACCLCYTSGTTGNPKGVLYHHRSMVLHTLIGISTDCFSLSVRDVVMPVVPMFHVNAWGLAYGAPVAGTKLVFPGPKMGDGATLQALIEEEEVTYSAGVPTVWLNLLKYLDETGRQVDTLKRVVIGGSACPRSIMEEFEERHGVYVNHAWGMTEMSPLGTFNTLKPEMQKLSREEQFAIREKQGRALYGVEMKIVDDENNELPWDGQSTGLLKVRGPFICSDYYNTGGPSDVHDGDGWFSTGDVGSIDAEGYLQITDRSKDVIKSGGEWISSIDLENAAVGHPDVAEAAVIGVPHPKWSERPLLVVVRKEGSEADKEEILDWLKDKVAKWWLPDDVVYVDEIPHTATGKIQKTELRKRFKDHVI